jgi:hypothetical protein
MLTADRGPLSILGMRLWILIALLAAACGSPPKGESRSRERGKSASADEERDGTDEFTDRRPVPRPPSQAEVREFDRIWQLYRKGDPRWPLERDRFRQRSEAAAYLLAAHLLRHYMVVNSRRDRAGRELVKVKNEIVEVGEPCAAPLVDMMVLERIPMRDGNYFLTDDITRQDCVDMLERMGGAALLSLLRALERPDMDIKARRLIALALGGTRDRGAFETLVRLLREDPSWQVRADAASALAKLGDRRALGPLQEAVRKDPDQAVVRRAGKARYELHQGLAK